jgi:hypothetical protein
MAAAATEAASQAAGALHRPAPLRPLLCPGQQLPARLTGGREALLAEQSAVGIQSGGGQRALVRIDADGDHGAAFRRGGQDDPRRAA